MNFGFREFSDNYDKTIKASLYFDLYCNTWDTTFAWSYNHLEEEKRKK